MTEAEKRSESEAAYVEANGVKYPFTASELDNAYVLAMHAFAHASSSWKKISLKTLIIDDIKRALGLSHRSLSESLTETASLAALGLMGESEKKLEALDCFEKFAAQLESFGLKSSDRAKTWSLEGRYATEKDVWVLTVLGHEKLAEAFKTQMSAEPDRPDASNPQAGDNSGLEL